MHEPQSHAAPLTLCVLLTALVMSLSLVACAGEAPMQGSPSASAAPTPRAGGSLTIGYLTPPETLDPAIVHNPTERTLTHAVYEGLLRYASKPGVAGTQLQACLVTQIPTRANGGLSVDGLAYTLTLRDGLRFQLPLHRELEAPDVKYSLERMLRLAPAKTRALYANVAGSSAFFSGRADHVTGITSINDRTIEIRLTQPDPLLLHALAQVNASIVAREWIEKWREDFGLHPLGTGPYVLLKWTADNEVKLARNPEYWGQGVPYVDAVDYVPVSTPVEGVDLLRSGAVDILGFTPDAATTSVPTAAPSELAGETVTTSRPLLSGTYLFLNTRSAPFRDVRVRRAVGMAVDRDGLAMVQPGRATALRQYYPPGLAGHEPGKDLFGFDPENARELLVEAGYTEGLTAQLVVVDGTCDPAMVRSLRADLSDVGIATKLSVVSARRFTRLSRTPRSMTMGIVRIHPPLPDPGSLVASLLTTAEGQNPSRWRSAALEARSDRADAMADAEARVRAYAELQTTIALAAPYIPLYSSTESTLCSPQVGGFYLHPVYQLDVAKYWTM